MGKAHKRTAGFCIYQMRVSGCFLPCSYSGTINCNIDHPTEKLNLYFMQKFEITAYTASVFTGLWWHLMCHLQTVLLKAAPLGQCPQTKLKQNFSV